MKLTVFASLVSAAAAFAPAKQAAQSTSLAAVRNLLSRLDTMNRYC